jgi:tetratricopeptide (TPR) repeat protein
MKYGRIVLATGMIVAAGCNGFTSQARNSEGVRLFDQGQYQAALRAFQEANFTDPCNPDAYYNLAATYHRLGRTCNQPGDLAQAETCYHQCLERDPNHRDCHRGLAVLLVEEGRTDEAFRSLQNWADQQPAVADAKIELARLYEEFGDKPAAKERLVEALAADPNNARQWAALGRLREESGEYSQALANYQRSVLLDPGQPELSARISALQGGVVGQPGSPVLTAATAPAAPCGCGPALAPPCVSVPTLAMPASAGPGPAAPTVAGPSPTGPTLAAPTPAGSAPAATIASPPTAWR